MDRENEIHETWNKKRIFIVLIILMLLGTGAYFFKPKTLVEKLNPFNAKPYESTESVKGVSVDEDKSPTPTTSEAKIDIQKAVRDTVKEKLEELRKEALKIDVAEIASSSPQIQKLIKDLSSIRDYPVNQAKEICEKVCGNLL